MVPDSLHQYNSPTPSISKQISTTARGGHTLFVKFGIIHSESQQLNTATTLTNTLLTRNGSKASIQNRFTLPTNPLHSPSLIPYSLKIGGKEGLNLGIK